jgi:hypothetical protein
MPYGKIRCDERDGDTRRSGHTSLRPRMRFCKDEVLQHIHHPLIQVFLQLSKCRPASIDLQGLCF